MAESFEPARYSPLADLPAAAGVEMVELPFVGKVNLRGDASDPAFRTAAEAQIGAALPTEPNTWRSNGDVTVFWLGPDEWLIHCADGAQTGMVEKLQQALAGVHCAVTDVSDYYLVIRLAGDKARELLSKGTPLDVHQAEFRAGMCAQTRFGHASVLIGCMDDAPGFQIQVRWSFSEYLWQFLVEGTREYETT